MHRNSHNIPFQLQMKLQKKNDFRYEIVKRCLLLVPHSILLHIVILLFFRKKVELIRLEDKKGIY